MTIPSSGAISFSQIAQIVKANSTASVSLGESDVRTLLGVGSGQISISSAYSKPTAGSSVYNTAGSYTFIVPAYQYLSTDVRGGGAGGQQGSSQETVCNCYINWYCCGLGCTNNCAGNYGAAGGGSSFNGVSASGGTSSAAGGGSGGNVTTGGAGNGGTANNSTYAYGKTEGALNANSSAYATNAGAATYATSAGTANNSTYAYGKTEGALNVNSSAYATTAGATTTTNNFRMNSLGIGTAASGTTGEILATNNITAYYSDRRLKTILENIPNPLDKVLSLSGIIYKNNEVAEKYGYTSQEEQVGVIAQEVENVLPQIVKRAPFDIEYIDGLPVSKSGEDYKTVQYEKIIPLLIEAIKELSNKVDQLQNKIG